VFNGDSDLLWKQRNVLSNVTYFGEENILCDVRAENVKETEDSVAFDVRTGAEQFSICLPMAGKHYVSDALAAVAVGMKLGVATELIAARLADFQNMAGRQEIIRSNEYTIIKDCYNAGPESMRAALNVLCNKPGRRIAVLGEMLELGSHAPAEHYKVGKTAAEKADVLLAIGPNSEQMRLGAIEGGLSDTCVKAFEDRDALVAALKQTAKPGDVLLFKGSRGMRMELALEAFLREDK
jgi:UDP-N-acetylmuramoyl-tripeptide--D-alanyl-D-alanine ligase